MQQIGTDMVARPIGDTTPYEHCVRVEWPGRRSFSSGFRRHSWGPAPPWVGSLLYHGKDPSGQMYRRNRYYDPSSGRFTQEDPIGIAGGLNVYGYAEGDPLSYGDPYGLKVIIRGSPSDVARFNAIIGFLVARSPSFRRVYERLDAADNVHVYVHNGLCGTRNCTFERPSGRISVNVGLLPDSYVRERFGFSRREGDWFMEEALSLVHEFMHAAAWADNEVETGVDRDCTNTDDRSGCSIYYENVVREELKQPLIRDSDADEWGEGKGNPRP